MEDEGLGEEIVPDDDNDEDMPSLIAIDDPSGVLPHALVCSVADSPLVGCLFDAAGWVVTTTARQSGKGM
jgi:hypothetical protein